MRIYDALQNTTLLAALLLSGCSGSGESPQVDSLSTSEEPGAPPDSPAIDEESPAGGGAIGESIPSLEPSEMPAAPAAAPGPVAGGTSGNIGSTPDPIPDCVEDGREALAEPASLPIGFSESAIDAAGRIAGSWVGACGAEMTTLGLGAVPTNVEIVHYRWEDYGTGAAQTKDCSPGYEFDLDATLKAATSLDEVFSAHVTIGTGGATSIAGSINLNDISGTARPGWEVTGFDSTTLDPWALLGDDGDSLSGWIRWTSTPIANPDCGTSTPPPATPSGAGVGSASANSSGSSSTCVAPGVAGILCSSWELSR